MSSYLDEIKIYDDSGPPVIENRYWVSSTDAPFSSSYWATESGGTSGASVPNAYNSVIYDRSSGPCLINSPIAIHGLILNSDYTNTISYTASVHLNALTLAGGYLTATTDSSVFVSGDVSCLSGFGSYSTTNNAVIVMDASGAQYITGGGIFPNLVVNKTTTNQVRLIGDLNINGDLILHDGTFNTNGYDLNLQG
jgi:hypothetical protein